MNITRMLKNIYNQINKNDNLFDGNVEENVNYINSFPEPANNFERSFYQYCCQTHHQNILLKLLQNFMACFILMGIQMNFKRTIKNRVNTCDALLLSGSMNFDYVPEEIKKIYPNICKSDVDIGTFFNYEDKKFIKNFKMKYKKYPFFTAKCLLKLGEYSKLFYIYKPQAILVNNEFSFTSSFLTEYCEHRGHKQINIMHGEKLLYIRDSFVNYHCYYVWDTYYIDLLLQLRAAKDIFKIATPNCLQLDFVNKNKYQYTYYLGEETEEELLNIRKCLLKLHKNKKELCVRTHPRYSDVNLVKKIFCDIVLEDKSCSLADSFGNTNCVITLYSTVLYQAFLNKKKCMLDDCSNPNKFQQLNKLKYIMLNKNILLMSEKFKECK